MPVHKIIAVVGATGAQGGGLARAILADPDKEFGVRALTRDTGSDEAYELARLGAEVVRADLDDEASVARAFDGAHGAFVVTNFWEHGDPAREQAQAGATARAAKSAGVDHVIWSTLDDTRELVPLDDPRMPTLQGRYKVPHFDAKAEANALFGEAGVPTTFLETTFYWENFLGALKPRREDGRLVVSFPMADSPIAGIASVDIGRTALGIFKRGDELVGRTVSIAGDFLTGDEVAAAFSRVLGEEVVYEPMPFDAMRRAGFPGAEDMGNMFQFYAEFSDEFSAKRDLDFVRELDPWLQTFEDWLVAHRDAFAGL
ncbi:NmrA/HSCARG family protein [Glycomyces xiaoerkulensis]|uniref:NmrA/HSCARG family protein n=1 Tax=Glycomyces xiaoerkulensis TaxID=2038139 RepID=UPI000C25C732|nr:NmrA/HSCARG family protein [Glycomyces xiaoerkulensis]